MPAESTPLFHFPALIARGYKPRLVRQALIQAKGDLSQAISICEAAAAPAVRPPVVIASASGQNAAVDQPAESVVASEQQASTYTRDPSGPPTILGPAAPKQASETTIEGSALQQRLKARMAERNKQHGDECAKNTRQNIKVSAPVPVQEQQNGGQQSVKAAELSKLGEQLLFATPEEVPAILAKLESWHMKVEQLVETRIGKMVRECCRAHGSDIRAQGDQLLQRWLQLYRWKQTPSASLSGSSSSPDSIEAARKAVTGSASSPESATPKRRESLEVVHVDTPKSDGTSCSIEKLEPDDRGRAVRTPVTPPVVSPAPASSGMPASTSKRPLHKAVCAASPEGNAESQKCGGPPATAGGSSRGGVEDAPAIPVSDSVDIDVEAWDEERRGRKQMAGNKSPLLKRRRSNKPNGSAVATTQQHVIGGVPARAELTWYDTSARKWMVNEDAGCGEQAQAHASGATALAAPQRSKIVRCDAIVQFADKEKVRCARCHRRTKAGTLRVAFPHEQPPGSGRLQSAFLHLACCAEMPRPLQGLSASCVLGLSGLGHLQKQEVNYALGLGGQRSSKSSCDSSRAMARAVAGGKHKELLRSLRLSPVYQALQTWREAYATETRVGPSDVVSDKVLVHLAHAAPRTVEELEAVQGLSAFKRSLFRKGILEAVRQGRTAKLEVAKKRHREEEELRPSSANWSAGLARQRMEAGDAPPV